MIVDRLRWRADPHRAILAILLFALAIDALFILSLGLTKPILEAHAFRQTQTAITVYWLLHGGPLVAYETPILGYPWSIPLEFPTYQWLTALLCLTGLSIDVAGRLIGFAFYLACLWPLRILLRTEGFDSRTYRIVAALFLGSPFYLYWSRTVMIESCAIFFDLCWLALFARIARSERLSVGRALAMIAVGTIGALTKITTFPGFLVIAGLVFLAAIRRPGSLRSRLSILGLLVAGAVLPIIATAIWVAYSDHVKAMNPFGAMLVSTNLRGWNFGTLKQRLSAELWLNVIINRAVSEALGYGKWLAPAILGAGLVERRYRLPVAACLTAFLAPFLIFTNLQIVHDYYQYAESLFLVAAVGLGLASVRTWARGWICMIALIAILVGGVVKFYRYYGHYLVADDPHEADILPLAELVRSNTTPDQSIIVLGFHWRPEIPYYGQRKALALPFTTDAALIRRVVDDPQSFLGTEKLGAIVSCDDQLHHYGDGAPLLAGFLRDRRVLGEVDGCRLLGPDRTSS